MAKSSAHSINLSELESAISSAVEHVKSQKLSDVPDLSRGPLIAGRYIREAPELRAEGERGLKQAAEHVTRQVNASVPGLNASPIVQKGLGGVLVGLVLREE